MKPHKVTMRLTISSILDCSLLEACEAIAQPRTMQFVSAPLLTFDASALPTRWHVGKFAVRLKLLSFVPIGSQTIGIELPASPSPDQVSLRDNGHGAIARVWDHRIQLNAIGARQCQYTDELRVEAGWWTPAVWVFAQIFYRHRQRRWKVLLRQLSNSSSPV